MKEPIQKRSIETRNKLMKTAIKLYADKGYHNVTVDEVASSAGLSTGVAYRYFKNKKDLLLATIQYAYVNIKDMAHMEDNLFMTFSTEEEKLAYIMDKFVMLHQKYYDFHEVLEGLKHSDPDVKELYDQIENSAMDEVINRMKLFLPNENNLSEKVYLAVSMLETYCHMRLDEQYKMIDFSFVKQEIIRTIVRFRD